LAPAGGELRVGLGFDSHPRDTGRPLHLGGVHFEGEPGLLGHSDGDVVCHALADALLGAAGLGDIGEHFPENDPKLAGTPGLDLLDKTVRLVAGRGYRPRSCDLTILADRPTVAPRRAGIRRNLAVVLGVLEGDVSVKATRPEGLGLTGDGAACLALAVLART
jgi:2-C-methyl-D-erythritol 2,4-cyclodiphosphate synthase